jgi:hypothetical protein
MNLKFKNPFKAGIDWLVHNYYSYNYIHKDMIRDEINQRLEDQEKRLIAERDVIINNIKRNLENKYLIKEEGYITELLRYEQRDKRREHWHEKVMELYYRVRRWAQELAVITATNQHHGKDIQENISEYIGKLDMIEIDAKDLNKEIKKCEPGDRELLDGVK